MRPCPWRPRAEAAGGRCGTAAVTTPGRTVADRGYTATGTLVPRREPGAVALARAVRSALGGAGLGPAPFAP
jgi:lactam utilization protein B